MQAQTRLWDYFNTTDIFDELYAKSKEGNTFNRLYEIIISKNNILLAYRTIKANKGSQTPGTDNRTIADYKNMSEDDFVKFIRKRLDNFQPMKVKRVYIPKANGEKRPLGIPTMSDRIIQQAIKQVMEPICEAKFYNHSYGFRPYRSGHHAIARMKSLINISKLQYVVDVDIKGFFDNVDHNILLKQIWNIGIRDRRLLKIISKMLKAEIEGYGRQKKGTPQGAILSPLLSNIVLNDLDQWVSSQWEGFPMRTKYATWTHKYKFQKRSKLKEGFIVRYADDFKIVCRSRNQAERWFHAVKLYLKDRLKLDISEEKSKIVNVRKSSSEFLGYTIKAKWNGKSKRFTARSHITDKAKAKHIQEAKKLITNINKKASIENVMKYNQWVLGVHLYSQGATRVCGDFNKIGYKLKHFMYNKLKGRAKHEVPKDKSETYKKFFQANYKTYIFKNIVLYPIQDVQHKAIMNFSQSLTPYTQEGRNKKLKDIDNLVKTEIHKMLGYDNRNKSIEYISNRASRYSMKKGKCEVTGHFLFAEDVRCHHQLPLKMGGDDSFKNLLILCEPVHRLIHATDETIINKYMKMIEPNSKQLKSINKYRKMCNLESI